MDRGLALACVIGLLGSPAMADDTVLQQGKADFIAHCAPCHGGSGKGDGPQAAHLQKKPADLTAISARYGRSFPEDRMFSIIAGLEVAEGHGTREMPIWGDVFVTEGVGTSTSVDDALKASDEASRRIAALVRYLETLQVLP